MVENRVGRVSIGTSGWQYFHWRGNFYPPDLPQKDWLKFYSGFFNTVEINSSFYRQTRPQTFEKWVSQVPKGFVFSVKGNRYITHIKRLRDCREAVERFFQAANALLTPKTQSKNYHLVLWQLPPSLKKDLGRFEDFLKLIKEASGVEESKLSSGWRHAFEFRHKSWVGHDVFTLMIRIIKAGGTIVFQDWREWPVLEDFADLFGGVEKLVERLPFVYIRFHGRKQLYASGYSDVELANWAKKMQEWISMGLDVYAYFNNDALGYAVSNASTLKNILKDVGHKESG